MFHVKHFLFLILLPTPFVIWSFLSILWSQNLYLAAFGAVKIAEGYILYIFLTLFVPRGTNEHSLLNVPRGTFYNKLWTICSTWNKYQVIFPVFIILGVLEATAAILQFANQSSLGLSFLKESQIAVHQAGIAKIIISGYELIRPYGFFSHPNVLGAFLAITLTISLVYSHYKFKMFHVEHNKLLKTAIFIQFLAFILTFSKTAYIGLIISLLFAYFKLFHVEQSPSNIKYVPRGTVLLLNIICSTWNKSIRKLRMFHVEQWLITILAVLGTIFLIYKIDLYYFITQPFNERAFLQESLNIIMARSPLRGVGISQSVIGMQQYYNQTLEPWQFQPIHNVYLIVLAELGVIGLTLFLFFFVSILYNMIINVPCGTISSLNTVIIISCLLLISFLMLFDHYFWDIQPTFLLFWVFTGLSARSLLKD